MQIIIFLVLLNVSFTLLGSTGIFFCLGPIDAGVWQSYTSWYGYSLFLTAVTSALGFALFGVNPFTTFAFMAMASYVLVSVFSLLAIVQQIGSYAQGAGPLIYGSFGIYGILVVITTILITYTLVQMATGGGKGFE